jgi:FAD/FMN-containing dehydrogenase
MARDAGNLIHRTPAAVLRPAAAPDIARMVEYCRRLRIQVAARGQGHTTFGQSQVEGGLVIDMSTLNTIHAIERDRIDVDAGATWRDVLAATTAHGLTPPVLTGFLGLSVGGTLSVGGVGAMSHKFGAQVDHVLELQVVTGEGKLETCSPQIRPDLFNAVRAGLGQCGIITRATLGLVPAPAMVRCYLLDYLDPTSFFHDLRELARRAECDMVSGSMMRKGDGSWLYQLSVAKYVTLGALPDEGRLFEGLRVEQWRAQERSIPFSEFMLRFDVFIDYLRRNELWSSIVHPWFDVFVPESSARRYVSDVLETLSPEDVGSTGLILLCPLGRSTGARPLLRVPDEELVFLFHLLTAAGTPVPEPGFGPRMLARNRRLFEAARSAGGTLYPIGAFQLSRADWVRQYGEAWEDFSNQKQRHDPARILTPGPGIF